MHVIHVYQWIVNSCVLEIRLYKYLLFFVLLVVVVFCLFFFFFCFFLLFVFVLSFCFCFCFFFQLHDTVPNINAIIAYGKFAQTVSNKHVEMHDQSMYQSTKSTRLSFLCDHHPVKCLADILSQVSSIGLLVMHSVLISLNTNLFLVAIP